MKAILLKSFGGPEQLYMGTAPEPKLGKNDLLVQVKAASLNRADLLQSKGHYPPPEGASEILGLEMAGEVISIGDNVEGWKKGDRNCGLLPGGGYAERVSIPSEMAIRLPDHFSFEQGAAVPEVFLTAYMNLVWLGKLGKGDKVLVHAGGSGVGTAAIQIVKEWGAEAIVTAGSITKLQRCFELGATAGWNYRDGSFAPWVQEYTESKGVNVILDFVGEPYFANNIKSLATEGRLIIIGTMGGGKVRELNLNEILSRKLQIIGTALRSRSQADKMKLTADFTEFAMPRFIDGRMIPVIDSVYDWREVDKAHEYMESNASVGKIVLSMT